MGSSPADGTRNFIVDRINVFLLSGTPADAATALIAAGDDDLYLQSLAWAAHHWAGPHWRTAFEPLAATTDSDGTELPAGVIAVLRDGAAQLTWPIT